MGLKVWTYSTLLGVALSLLSCAVSSRRGGSFPAQMENSENSAAWLYSEGIRLSLMGADSATVAPLFERALKKDSIHAPSWYELANLNDRDPQKALIQSLKANQIDSTNRWYQDQLARLYIRIGEYPQAIESYLRLLESNPENPEIYSRLAALYGENKQPYAAIAILDSAETRFGINEMHSAFKRQLLVGVKLYDKALTEGKQLTESFPYEPSNWVAMGELYAQMGQDSLAEASYARAMSIDSTNIQTLISLNEYYKRKGNNIQFIATARKLIASEEIDLSNRILFFEEITQNREFYKNYYIQLTSLATTLAMKHPNDFRVTKLYGSHLIAGGNFDEAAKLYKAQLTQSDTATLRESFNEVLNIEAYLGRTDSLEKYTQLAISRFPENIDFYLRSANVLSYYGKEYGRAEATFLKALSLTSPKEDSLRAQIYAMLGDNSQAEGEEQKAIKFYDLSLKHKRDNAMVLNNYAYMLSEMNTQIELAQRMSSRANELEPNNATFLDTEAWILYRQGRYQEAQQLIKRVLSLEPNAGAEILLHYGDILAALGDEFMAKFYWNKALDKGADPEEIVQRLNPNKE